MPGYLLLYHRLWLTAKARNIFISRGILEIFSSYPGADQLTVDDTDLDQEDNAGKPPADMEEDETFSWLDIHPRG